MERVLGYLGSLRDTLEPFDGNCFTKSGYCLLKKQQWVTILLCPYYFRVALIRMGHVSIVFHYFTLTLQVTKPHMLQSLSLEQKIEFTKKIMAMLDNWGVSHENKILLLNLPPEIKTRVVRRFYIDKPLPEDNEVIQRIEHLLGIADAIRTSYPLNGQMAAFWLNKKNERFENKTPLEFMLQGGSKNVIAIRAHLDCAWDWGQDELNDN
jgi:hypothetical protein